MPSAVTPGIYYLLACANDASPQAPESTYGNNCAASSAKVSVGPDFIVTAVTAVKQLGGSFNVSETVKNVGTNPAAASVTQYYVSVYKTKNSAAYLLTGSDPVGTLGVQLTATPATPVNVTVPTSVPAGTYYLLACANDAAPLAPESGTANNCTVATSQVQVTH